MEVQVLFYSGNYRQVLANTVDSEFGQCRDEDLAFVIGALTFRGRLQEAETFYRLRNSSVCPISHFAVRFFLGVGYCRISEYAKARNYFGQNLRSGARDKNSRIRFFAWQGHGFYRYSFCRYKAGYRSATRAFEAAIEDGFLYGKAVASDLMAHCQLLPGQISASLKSFDDAIEFAQLLGDGGLVQAITVSRLIHSAQFGIDPHQDLPNLVRFCAEVAPEDNYSKSRLLLEIARQHTLRGDVHAAKVSLDQACQRIYSSKIRRHSIVLNHRYANLAYLSGDVLSALNLIQNAHNDLDLSADRSLAREVWGLEQKILDCLRATFPDGEHPELVDSAEKLKDQLEQQRRHGNAVNSRILERVKTQAAFPVKMGDDPLGDLLDLCRTRKNAAVQDIVAKGYFGLFLYLVEGAVGKRILYFDLFPDSLLVIDRGQVLFQEKAASNIVRSIALQLRDGQEQSKQDLIENIWGYKYQALRHDSIVYRNVSRFRALLGKQGDWLRATETGYRFDEGVEVIFHQSTALPGEVPISVAQRVQAAPLVQMAFDLNLRQIKILDWLRDEGDSIDPKTFVRKFEVSEVTARRDLGDLCKLGLLTRLGKGPATRYVLRR